MSNQIQKNPMQVMRGYLQNIDVQKRLEETLGKRAGAFSNSIINVVKNNSGLQKCEPDSIMSAAMIAATMNMPIDPALGFAAIVPYGKKATFQLMYKGVCQLCIRSNQYRTIHCTEVYSDELVSYNPITSKAVFNNIVDCSLREKGNVTDIVGFYAYFELLSGFIKSDFMSLKDCMNHAKKYSKAYQYDLAKKRQTSKWSTDPIPMARKTVLLRILTRYGIMSIEMQDALVRDFESYETEQAHAEETIQEQSGSEAVEAEFEQPEQVQEPAEDDTSWMND